MRTVYLHDQQRSIIQTARGMAALTNSLLTAEPEQVHEENI